MAKARELPRFSVVVPNWNGEAFLRRGLGSLLLSARRTGKPHEFIVVDDASRDGGPALIEGEFPMIWLTRRRKNGGFAPTANEGVRLASAPIVILANNDLIAREEFIPRLLEAMEDESVFAVSAKTIDWERGEPNHVAMSAIWRDGLLGSTHANPTERVAATFLQAGACALRREPFLAMGGFSGLFAPGYWEDYDLSYQAVKRGMKVVYEPAAIAHHLSGPSMRARHGREKIEIIRKRNQILFTWLNLTDAGLWARHLVQFPLAVARDAVHGENSTLLKGFLRALKKLPRLLANRRKRRPAFQLSDSQILQ